MAAIKDLAFGGWDVFPDNAYEAAAHADVLQRQHLDLVKDELSAVKPMKAVFYPEYVKRLHGPNVKTQPTKAAMVEELQADIKRFIKDNGCSRAVAVWCGSTEAFLPPGEPHQSIKAFEKGLAQSDPLITNSQMYAWASLKEGVPFANGSPNFAVDFPAIWELAKERQIAIAGKDFKTGQTMMKTVIAPALKARMLGLRGWYSTNILGNRDGEILDDPESFRTKETTKLGVLDTILQADQYKELYADFCHKVRIDYYPPRGDAEGRLGQHRPVRVAGLPDADQDQLPLPRLDPGRAGRPRPAPLPRPGAARRDVEHPGVAELLLQEPDDGAGPVPRARSLHPADEAEEHAALDDG